jgi:hypothetical protein
LHEKYFVCVKIIFFRSKKCQNSPQKMNTATCPVPILTELFIFSGWPISQYGNWAGEVFIFCWRALIWTFNELSMWGKKPTNRLYLHDRPSRVLFLRLLSWYGLFVGFVRSGSLEFDNVKEAKKTKISTCLSSFSYQLFLLWPIASYFYEFLIMGLFGQKLKASCQRYWMKATFL